MNVWLHGWLINYDDLSVSVFICDQERDAMRLMSCVGQVLSVLPIPDIMNYLDAILVPRLTNMQQLVKQEVGFCMFLFQMCLNVIHTTTHTKQKTHDASYGSWKKRKRPVVLQFFLEEEACFVLLNQGWANYSLWATFGLRMSLDWPVCQNVKSTCFHLSLFSIG